MCVFYSKQQCFQILTFSLLLWIHLYIIQFAYIQGLFHLTEIWQQRISGIIWRCICLLDLYVGIWHEFSHKVSCDWGIRDGIRHMSSVRDSLNLSRGVWPREIIVWAFLPVIVKHWLIEVNSWAGAVLQDHSSLTITHERGLAPVHRRDGRLGSSVDCNELCVLKCSRGIESDFDLVEY